MKKPPKIICFLIIMFCVLWSGGAATYSIWNMWPVYALIINVLLVIMYKIKIKPKAWVVLLLINSLTFVQMLVHKGGITTLVHQILIVSDVFLFSFLVAESFPKYFVKIVTFFAITSIPFYILDNSGFHTQLLSIANSLPQGGVENMHEIGRQTTLHTLYIYNLADGDPYVLNLRRNCGPFWEPGRFTIFLNIAILINLFYFRKPILSKSNIFLILVNITAMSTTGISAMLLIFMVYVLKGNISTSKKVFWGLLFITIIPSILSLEFMADKIGEEFANDASYSRFGAITYHITQIKESPIIGYGPFLSTVFGMDLAVSPNGVSDSVRFFGIPIAIFVWFLLYCGTKVYINGRTERITAFVVLMLLAFTQTITMNPFYYLLYFFAIVPEINHNNRV